MKRYNVITNGLKYDKNTEEYINDNLKEGEVFEGEIDIEGNEYIAILKVNKAKKAVKKLREKSIPSIVDIPNYDVTFIPKYGFENERIELYNVRVDSRVREKNRFGPISFELGFVAQNGNFFGIEDLKVKQVKKEYKESVNDYIIGKRKQVIEEQNQLFKVYVGKSIVIPGRYLLGVEYLDSKIVLEQNADGMANIHIVKNPNKPQEDILIKNCYVDLREVGKKAGTHILIYNKDMNPIRKLSIGNTELEKTGNEVEIIDISAQEYITALHENSDKKINIFEKNTIIEVDSDKIRGWFEIHNGRYHNSKAIIECKGDNKFNICFLNNPMSPGYDNPFITRDIQFNFSKIFLGEYSWSKNKRDLVQCEYEYTDYQGDKRKKNKKIPIECIRYLQSGKKLDGTFEECIQKSIQENDIICNPFNYVTHDKFIKAKGSYQDYYVRKINGRYEVAEIPSPNEKLYVYDQNGKIIKHPKFQIKPSGYIGERLTYEFYQNHIGYRTGGYKLTDKDGKVTVPNGLVIEIQDVLNENGTYLVSEIIEGKSWQETIKQAMSNYYQEEQRVIMEKPKSDLITEIEKAASKMYYITYEIDKEYYTFSKTQPGPGIKNYSNEKDKVYEGMEKFITFFEERAKEVGYLSPDEFNDLRNLYSEIFVHGKEQTIERIKYFSERLKNVKAKYKKHLKDNNETKVITLEHNTSHYWEDKTESSVYIQDPHLQIINGIDEYCDKVKKAISEYQLRKDVNQNDESKSEITIQNELSEGEQTIRTWAEEDENEITNLKFEMTFLGIIKRVVSAAKKLFRK